MTSHKHRCRNCGCCWQHGDDVIHKPAKTRAKAHQCPRCGKYAWAYYRGPQHAEFVNHHLDAPVTPAGGLFEGSE